MKTIKSRLAILLVLALALALCGCGSSYSKAMEEAAGKPGFGSGDKIAVYDAQKQQYVKKYLDAADMAQAPEEVGAILTVTPEGDQLRLVLAYADGREIASETRSNRSTTIGKWAAEQWIPCRNDRDLRAFYDSGAECAGKGVAVYDVLEDRFGYSHKLLPLSFLVSTPKTPEDIALFAEVENYGYSAFVTLRAAGGGPVVASKGFSDVIQLSGLTFESEIERKLRDSVQTWTKNLWNGYLTGRSFTALLDSEELGGGDKIMGFDEDAGIYIARYVPEELQAKTPSEAGLIARFHTERTETEKSYYLFGTQRSDETIITEKVTMTLVDARTGEVVAETELETKAPDSVSSSSRRHWIAVGEGSFYEWMRAQAEAYFG